MPVTVAVLDAIPALAAQHGGGERRAVREHFGLTGFGANVFRGAQVGDPIVGEHDHSEPEDAQHEELYVVLRGRATFRVGAETIDAPAGTLIAVRDLTTIRSATAAEPGTEVLVIGGEAGASFEL